MEGKSNFKKELSCWKNAPLSSSRSVGVRDIRGAIKNFAAPIPRIETLRGDEARQGGFTLIELLVVVLIIGILAAVAVPQYRVAVGKAQLAKIIPSVTAGKTALEMYYLANGSYPLDSTTTDFGFDLDLPDCGSGRAGTTGGIICPDGSYYDLLDYGVANAAGWSKPYQVGYMVWLTHSEHPDERRCLAVSANEVAKKICKSMGGTEISGETHRYFRETTGDPITVYKLP